MTRRTGPVDIVVDIIKIIIITLIGFAIIKVLLSIV